MPRDITPSAMLDALLMHIEGSTVGKFFINIKYVGRVDTLFYLKTQTAWLLACQADMLRQMGADNLQIIQPDFNMAC